MFGSFTDWLVKRIRPSNLDEYVKCRGVSLRDTDQLQASFIDEKTIVNSPDADAKLLLLANISWSLICRWNKHCSLPYFTINLSQNVFGIRLINSLSIAFERYVLIQPIASSWGDHYIRRVYKPSYMGCLSCSLYPVTAKPCHNENLAKTAASNACLSTAIGHVYLLIHTYLLHDASEGVLPTTELTIVFTMFTVIITFIVCSVSSRIIEKRKSTHTTYLSNTSLACTHLVTNNLLANNYLVAAL